MMVGVLAASSLSSGLFAEDERPVAQQDEQRVSRGKPGSPEAIGQAFEQAIHSVEAEKTQQEELVASTLEAKLSDAVRDWIAAERAKKASALQQPVDQQWEKLQEFFGSPLHYDYYLRDFSYTAHSQDIVKTTSVRAPYKATVQFVEKLYVTRYYPPNSSRPEDFRYTATTPLSVAFEYRGDRFLATDTQRGRTSVDKGWQRE